jgi:parallel beta-helix repeat protein
MVDEQSLLEANVFDYGDDPKVFNENRLLIAFVVLVLVVSAAPLSKTARVRAASEIHVFPGQSIQDAINGASDGDTIVVENGIHVEGQYPIVVNRSITLTGQNVLETVIDGNGSNRGILLVKTDGVRIFNLTIQKTTESFGVSGISLYEVRFVEVSDCIVANCGDGLLLTNSSENNITRNSIVNNKNDGIYLRSASSFNIISENNVTHNPKGITIVDTNCQHNAIYHNNFVANTNQQSDVSTSTSWDNGYPSGGNYWDDHANEDLFNGVGQNLTGSDGIADASYRDTDEYPLADPVYVFHLYEWNHDDYYALISSNWTVYDFKFDPSVGSFLTFEAVGPEGTVGCCKLVLPKNVLWVEEGESWIVTVNGTAPATNPLILEDVTSTSFFLTYNHSAEVIEIAGTHVVPEYNLLIFLLLMVSSVGASFFMRRKGEGLKLSG